MSASGLTTASVKKRLDKRDRRQANSRQKAMENAVQSMQGYVRTYSDQAFYTEYLDKTYVEDMLYGIGLSMQHLMPSDFSGPGGFERFKQYLREHLK